METIRCLYLEHDDDAYARNSSALAAWWKSEMQGGALEFERATTVEEANAWLDERVGTYKLFISDILFPPFSSPREKDRNKHLELGLDAIKHASKMPRLVVVGLSAGPKKGTKGFGEEVLIAGADIFRYIDEVFAPGKTSIFCSEIRDKLLEKGVVPDPTPLQFKDDDMRVAYVVHAVGESTLKTLCKRLFPDPANMLLLDVNYLAPGMSGAFVLRVEAHRKRAPTTSYFLKMSTNKDRLTLERDRCPKNGPYANTLVLGYLNASATANQWHAIAAGYQTHSTPLRTWLLEDHTPEEVHGIMTALFLGGGLTLGYLKDLSDDQAPQRAVEALNPSGSEQMLSRRARIVVAMEELDSVITSSALGGVADWDRKQEVLRNYLLLQQLLDIPTKRMPERCFLCQCHGDLHTKNVLVSTVGPPVPTIIDWAEYGTYHWATDYARLLADMILSLYNAGSVSYEWGHVEKWLGNVNRLLSLEEMVDDSGDKNRSVVLAVNWMLRSLPSVYPAMRASVPSFLWEFQLAMAVEFMRGAYRQDLTAPKRVLGLVAAHLALDRSATSLQGSHLK